MAKSNSIRNIRIADAVWFRAKEDAVHNRMTLQDWITLLILYGRPDVKNGESDELQIVGKG